MTKPLDLTFTIRNFRTTAVAGLPVAEVYFEGSRCQGVAHLVAIDGDHLRATLPNDELTECRGVEYHGSVDLTSEAAGCKLEHRSHINKVGKPGMIDRTCSRKFWRDHDHTRPSDAANATLRDVLELAAAYLIKQRPNIMAQGRTAHITDQLARVRESIAMHRESIAELEKTESTICSELCGFDTGERVQ